MKLEDGTEISEEQIEILNANGPYSMAIWRSGDVSVGNEEGLSGRSEYFTKLIREAILKNYTLDEIKKISILDIGCNDGWVLQQLSDLPFNKMVGIEPREKNINKGHIVRKILKLESSVEYRIGDIESLKNEVFDIVICAGLLYHVESIPFALRKVREACKHLLFIESRVISSSYISQELKDEIEMRDLVYQFEDEICGVTAQKYESSYYDGSAANNTIVNIPTTESLVMNLKILGFNNIDIVADADTYRRDVWKDKRPLGGVCISATLSQEPITFEKNERRWINDYEKGLEAEVFPRQFLEPFYCFFCLKEIGTEFSSNSLDIYNFLTSQNDVNSIKEDFLPNSNKGKFALEIVKNWRYSPSDKIALEYAKLLKYEGNFENAISVLKDITTKKINSDWRAVYRAFHLLFIIYSELKNQEEAIKYKELCLKSNNKYPIESKWT
ncbi:class I SAM-dependent methyltransferase [Alphaproteobacteria bacterium]|nr:class I SAM-dependent methyltransferase [Alphaproteobacteria bacterium]MDC1023396.1 class I SAM-dependent methyltransferase [Alphaproteobacteria bacterium]